MKHILLIMLLCVPAYAKEVPLTHQEQVELLKQKEKDDHEYRLAVLKSIGSVSVVLIAALVKMYLDQKD